MNNPMKVRNPT